MGKLFYGVGINDANYVVQPLIDGSRVMCDFYRTWHDMLKRCYSEKWQEKSKTYIGCSVCEEWLTFSNFKRWMEKQDWQGKELDKDILLNGNKLYCQSACAFVDSVTNSFVTERTASRGGYPIGVSLESRSGKFKSNCSNPFTKKQEFLGYFKCPNEAYEAWKKRKHELSCQLADLQADERVAVALRARYS